MIKVFHIIPHEGKFLSQLTKSMSAIEGTDSRYVLFPIWLKPSQVSELDGNITIPQSQEEFDPIVVEGFHWADIVIVHGMTRQAGRALAKIDNELFKDTSLVWSVWGFDLFYANPQLEFGQYLPLTWIEVAKAKRVGIWKRNRFTDEQWKGPKEDFGRLLERAIYRDIGGPRLHMLLNKFSRKKRRHPPEWLQAVARRVDVYCSLERQNSIETRLPEFRGVYHQMFPYFSLSGLIDWDATRKRQYNNILVGGRSHASSNHLDALSLLEDKLSSGKFAYLPLSYGDIAYGDMVASHATRRLGQAARPIRNWMSLKDYAKLLSETDTVLMSQIRGQSLGTEILAMARGAKLYLWPENPHAKFFRNAGINIETIEQSSKLEGIWEPLSAEQITENLRILDHNFSDAAILRRITEILNRAKERSSNNMR